MTDTIDHIVNREVVTIDPRAYVFDAVADMADFDVGTVVVVEDDRPIGIVTDRKIALAVERSPDLADRRIEEFMTPDPICVAEGTSIHEALDIMADEGIRRLPVVSRDGHLEGIVAMDDVLLHVTEELSAMREVILAQSPEL